MNSTDFTYWLQGFVELTESDGGSPHISEKQWLVIKDHLKLVFDKKTPDRNKFPSTQDIIYSMRPKPVDLVGKQFAWWHQNPVQITC